MNEREQLAAGERAESAGDYPRAESAFRTVAASADQSLAAEAHFHLGRVRWRQGRFAAALGAFEIARGLSARASDDELRARVENGIGAVHYARGEYTEARRSYAMAAERTRDRAMRGKIILNLGVIENIEGNLAAARDQYDRALALFQECGDDASAMLALHNRGMVEADLEQWNSAEQSFLNALALATELGNNEMIARTLVNRSEVLVRRDAHAEAIEDCERAMETYSQLGDEIGRGEALRRHAHALRLARQFAAAERSANEAVQIAVRSGVRLLEAEAARELAIVRRARGDEASADKLLLRALGLFTELGAARDALEVERLRGARSADPGEPPVT